jgi:hypothetical protein
LRTIIDAVAELHAQADLASDKAYEWDVNAKSGKDLDDFVALFGFTRIPATHAAGYATITFASNTTRDYLIDTGTTLSAFRGGGTRIDYITTTDIAIPAHSTFQTLPIIAVEPGASSNARPGEVTYLDYEIESFVMIKNDDPISGGRGAEGDAELRERFRSTLFRNVLGTEAYYRSIALRHPRASAVQLIGPSTQAEEYLKVIDGEVQCQEDSLIFTYPNSFQVYSTRLDLWFEEGRDFTVTVNNDNPTPPLLTMTNPLILEGDTVTVRYTFCSKRSRNSPRTNTLHFLDLYILGQQPTPILDLAVFPPENIFGSGSITADTHPQGAGFEGAPYYIFTHQPVRRLASEFDVAGRRYYEGRDYMLVLDESMNAGSTEAKDLLLWKSTLPPTSKVPEAFNVPYFAEGMIEDIQAILDDPAMVSATDNVMAHAAEEVVFDVSLSIEWTKGIKDEELVRDAISTHFAEVQMGTTLRAGPLLKDIGELHRVTAVFLTNFSSESTLRSKNLWRYDVPLPDGTVPILGNLTIETLAPNVYE